MVKEELHYGRNKIQRIVNGRDRHLRQQTAGCTSDEAGVPGLHVRNLHADDTRVL